MMTTSLRSDLELTPVDDGERWVIRDPRNDRYVRIRARELRYLLAGDEVLPHGAALKSRLEEWGLLAGADEPPHRDSFGWLGRLQVSGLLTIRYRLLDPDAALGRMVATRRRRIGVAILAILLVAVAVMGFATAGAAAHRATTERQSTVVTEIAVFIALIFLGTGLHELAHALAARWFGAHVRSCGVMLFYLAPAAYCDITDVWRVNSRRRRVIVAVAGPAMSAVVGGGCLFAASSRPTGAVSVALFGAALTHIAFAIANLFPGVKLDGYWAVAFAVDRPRLREEAIESLGSRAKAAMCRPPVPTPTRSRWLAAYGAITLISGAGLVVSASTTYSRFAAASQARAAVLPGLLLLAVVAICRARPSPQALYAAARTLRTRAVVALVLLAALTLSALLGIQSPVYSEERVGPAASSPEVGFARPELRGATIAVRVYEVNPLLHLRVRDLGAYEASRVAGTDRFVISGLGHTSALRPVVVVFSTGRRSLLSSAAAWVLPG